MRFVDDFALFADDAATLERHRDQIARYLERLRLSLHPRKTAVIPTAEPACFLGMVLHSGGRRSLPDASVRRFRNQLRSLRDRWRAGRVDAAEVERRVGGFIAHAEHAHTWRLRRAIFDGGWFDPSLGPGRSPSRVLRGGSWNNNARNLRSANRNRNAPENRNNNFGFRVASTLSVRAARSTDRAGAPRSVQDRP